MKIGGKQDTYTHYGRIRCRKKKHLLQKHVQLLCDRILINWSSIDKIGERELKKKVYLKKVLHYHRKRQIF